MFRIFMFVYFFKALFINDLKAAISIRKFCTEQMFVLVRMQLRKHVDATSEAL